MTTLEGDARDLGAARAARLWSGVENGGLALISFISLAVFSRLLTPADFGVFSVALSVSEMASLLVTMLFHDALIQRQNVSDRHFDVAFTLTLILATLICVLGFICESLWHARIAAPKLGYVLQWIGLSYPFQAIGATIVARQRRELRFKELAFRSLAGRVTGAMVGFASAFAGFGVMSLVAQQVVTSGVSSIVLWLTCPSSRTGLRWDTRALFELSKFGLWSVGGIFLTFFVKRLYIIMVGVSIDITQAGYLNLGFRIVDMLWAILATALTQASLPTLSRLCKSPAALKEAYEDSVSIAACVILPAFAGLALVSPELVEVCFGSVWRPSSSVVAVLACLTLLQCSKLFTGPILSAIGKPHLVFISLGLQIAIVMLYSLFKGFSDTVSALALWAILELIQVPLSYALVRVNLGYSLREQYSGSFAPFVSAAVMVSVLVACRFGGVAQMLGSSALIFTFPVIGILTYTPIILALDKRLFRAMHTHLYPIWRRASLTCSDQI